MPDSPADLPRFEKRELIAEGAYARVLGGWDRVRGERVVIKEFLSTRGHEEWQREVTALRAVRHEHVVRLIEPEAQERAGFIVLEWLPGGTLENGGRLEGPAWVELCRQLLAALTAVHDQGFLHRDVKPANVMRGTSGWKLIDFGQARRLDEARMQVETGSVHCMAPEQFEKAMLDERTDLYAAGCTLWWALTGSFPHEGETTVQVITSHLREPLPELLMKVPLGVKTWLRSLLARLPQDRPATARLAWQALERVL